MSSDILVVVDCQRPKNSQNQLPAEAVTMYAADASIVRNNSQGSNELHVQVPTETNLRWRAVPLQMSQGAPEGQTWHVVITQARLWAPSGNQLDASQFLIGWGAFGGTTNGPAYRDAYTALTFNPSTPPAGGSSLSNQPGVQIAQLTDPFVQCTTNGEMQTSQYVAYSFTCTIYQGGQVYGTVTWDPYVTVVAPGTKSA